MRFYSLKTNLRDFDLISLLQEIRKIQLPKGFRKNVLLESTVTIVIVLETFTFVETHFTCTLLYSYLRNYSDKTVIFFHFLKE